MIIHILDLFGIAVCAATGALAAGRKRMDLFGIVVVAIVTAIGGGTIRDVILGIRPVFWISDPMYVIIATSAALVTFIAARHLKKAHPLLLIFDALGLAFFTVIGCQKAFAMHVPYVIVVVMGMITGVAGGIIRDILCGEIPLVLRKEIYATASLLGGVVLVTLRHFDVPRGTSVMIGAAAVLVLRLAAIYWQLSLPVFRVTRDKED